MSNENKFEMVAKTFQGLEDVLRDELISLGAENVETGCRMVTFEGDQELLYKANFCCRSALRILKPIVKFQASDADQLYDIVRDLEWEDFMDADTTFSVDSTVNSQEFTNSRFVIYRVKDGIVDHFYDSCRRRPNVQTDNADLQLNVHIDEDRVTISLDSSGAPLYQRGYRVAQTKAPINEVLAAGIILKTGWRGDTDFIDPMCGSGTFLIEAALIATNTPPGVYRQNFAFEKWKDFDKELFESIYEDDSEERDFDFRIIGGDIDGDAIGIARRNVKSAGLEKLISLEMKPFQDWDCSEDEPGILVTNPPYGERLRPDDIDALYREIGNTLKRKFSGWHAWMIGYKDEQFKQIGLKPSLRIPLHNGSLECELREYVMFNGNYSEFRAEGGSVKNESFKKEGPRKMRRTDDREWKDSASKFNKKAGRKENFDSKDRKKEKFSPKGKENREFRKDDRFGKKEKNFDRKERRDRDFDRKDRNFDRKGKNFDRKGKPEKKNISADYPAGGRAHGPRLGEDNAMVFSKFPIRSRRPKKDIDESEEI